MAAPSSKNPCSSSPVPSRPSNSRNSDINNAFRSFSGTAFTKSSITTSERPDFNPNTPANSPSDHPRRSSLGKENVEVSLIDSQDKGNSKYENLKQARARSPASSKGTKNFMSPTISATSKINASQRKKILTERNEPTGTSFTDCINLLKEDLDPEKGSNRKKVSFDPTITYLEDKGTSKSNEYFDSMAYSSPKDDWELTESVTVEKGWRSHSNQEEVVSVDPRVSYLDDKGNLTNCEDFDSLVHSGTKDDWDSLSERTTVENDSANHDLVFKVSPRASCSLAPLDADPSMLPYDPKINYLSPRPQFLHYKPNPRIQMYLNKERDGKQLEESSTSETSDTEVTEEESDDSQKEPKDASSSEVMNKEDEEEEELLVSRPNPMSESEMAVEAKRVHKQHFFTKTKYTALLLILSIACLWASVTNSPVMEPSVLNNLSFPNPYVPPEILKFIRDNLEGIAQKFQQWIYDYFSYIYNLISSFREWPQPTTLQLANLTTLLKDGSADNYLFGDHSPFGAARPYEKNELRLTREREVDIKSLEEEEDQLIEANKNVGELEQDEETDENIEEAIEGEKNDREYEDEEVIAAHDNLEVSVDDIVLESEDKTQAEVIEPGNTPTEMIEKTGETSGSISELQSKRDVGELEQDEETDENIEEAIEGEKNDREYEDEKVIAAHDNLEVLVDDIVLESEDKAQAEVTEPGNTPTEIIEKTRETSGSIDELQSKTEGINLLVLIPQAAEIQTEDFHPIQPLVENDKSSAATQLSTLGNKPESLYSDYAIKNTKKSESVDLTIHGKNLFSTQTVMGISLLVLGLLASFAFIYMKNKTSTTPHVAIPMDQAPMTKKLDYSPLSAFQERTADVPSEMSSFVYSSSYSKEGNKGTKESLGQGRKRQKNPRRESSDYSTGSLSYGSFTTYEKILSKNGNGEEELFTPVRRSSRIRNHSLPCDTNG